MTPTTSVGNYVVHPSAKVRYSPYQKRYWVNHERATIHMQDLYACLAEPLITNTVVDDVESPRIWQTYVVYPT